MLFIGLDLAWTPHNPTGAALVRATGSGGALVGTAVLGSLDTIVDYVLAAAPASTPALVAVDAPLCVPNTTGSRPSERELAAVFAKYQASAHPANRSLPSFRQGARGEQLVTRLLAHGFTHDCAITPGVPVRQVIEVYPHAAMVALFGLPRTLKYKAKPRRTRATRLDAWQHYQAHLAGLAAADPPLVGLEQFVAQDVAALRGRALKDYEDQADAVMCAYIALFGFRWGGARCRTFGTLAQGYIYTPVPSAM
ncbi:MAG: DUF429 domain-containing protein [Kouleothrix sp.]